MAMDLYQTWRSGKVNRMHTMPQLIRENTAEHTWGVYIVALKFYPTMRTEFRDAIILHDFGEQKPGDIPGHVKWANPTIREVVEQMEAEHIADAGFTMPTLTEDETTLLEIFDRGEFCVSCLHEIRMGNLNACDYYARSGGRLMGLIRSMPQYREDGREINHPALGIFSPEKMACLKFRDELRRLTSFYLKHTNEKDILNVFG